MRRGIRLTSLLLVVVCLSLAALTTWQIWFSRERALHDLNVSNLNLVQALDNYTEGVIRQCELTLLDLVERLQHDGRNPTQLARLEKVLHEQIKVLGPSRSIIIYDAQGNRLLSSSGTLNPSAPNGADRAFFIHHRDDPSDAIFIGPTIKSRISGEWVFTVSRRLQNAEGQFDGVVAVTLGVEQFLHLFGRFDVGKQGAVSLSTSDGMLLFRHPFREQDIGLNWSDSPILKLLERTGEINIEQASRIDGVERLYAARRNERLPLITVVARGRDEALASWRRDAKLFTTLILILVVSVAIIGSRLLVDIRRRSRAERQLRNAREELLDANSRLEILASQDALTGLANRRSFDQTLEVEIRRAQRRGSPLSLLMMDIDLFKRYNDHYGHVAGDACLRAVAEQLKQCVRRPGDLAARYGGEEMVVILPNTDPEGAQAVAEAFMQNLAQANLSHQASPFERVTASVGLASVVPGQAHGPTSSETLLGAADQALYNAKAKGRNRIESAPAERDKTTG